jgi:hypothetical protein
MQDSAVAVENKADAISVNDVKLVVCTEPSITHGRLVSLMPGSKLRRTTRR